MGRRTVILVRHGEYDMNERGSFGLTARGREQARLTGRALANEPIGKVLSSSLVRARETAELVTTELGLPFKTSYRLAEGVPTAAKGSNATAAQIALDATRLDGAWNRYFQPAKADTTDVIVCHANVIRYFICRALRIRTTTWTRFFSNHCGITRIFVKGSGSTRILSYNETVHLPVGLVT